MFRPGGLLQKDDSGCWRILNLQLELAVWSFQGCEAEVAQVGCLGRPCTGLMAFQKAEAHACWARGASLQGKHS